MKCEVSILSHNVRILSHEVWGENPISWFVRLAARYIMSEVSILSHKHPISHELSHVWDENPIPQCVGWEFYPTICETGSSSHYVWGKHPIPWCARWESYPTMCEMRILSHDLWDWQLVILCVKYAFYPTMYEVGILSHLWDWPFIIMCEVRILSHDVSDRHPIPLCEVGIPFHVWASVV